MTDAQQTEVEDTNRMGCVYVLKRNGHKSMCKVGFSSVSAKLRASQYTDGEWIVHQEIQLPIWLARLVEKESHNRLAEYWLDPKLTGGTAKEVFLCEPEIAEITVEDAKQEKILEAVIQLGIPPLTARELLISSSSKITISPAIMALKEVNQALNSRVIHLESINYGLNNSLQRSSASGIEFEREQHERMSRAFESLSIELTTAKHLIVELRNSYESESRKNSDLEAKLSDLLKPTLAELKISISEFSNFEGAKTNYADFAFVRSKLIEAIYLINKLTHLKGL